LNVKAEKRKRVTGDWTKVFVCVLASVEIVEAEASVRCDVEGGAVLAGVEIDGVGSALRNTQFLCHY
jgi:hypothetical protein